MSYENVKEQYVKYLELTCSGMLRGKFGNKEAQRRMQKIRNGLKSCDKEMSHLLLDCKEEIYKYTRKGL